MKPFSTAFSAIALAPLLFHPQTATADKMHPEMGYRYVQNRGGFNASANCRHPPINICQGCTVTIRMWVKQGSACPLNFKSLGPFAGQQILVRPQHGIFGSANETATAYQPNPGYAGRDHFETRVFFENGTGRPTAMGVNVNVLVAP
jgi:hypothetical protein